MNGGPHDREVHALKDVLRHGYIMSFSVAVCFAGFEIIDHRDLDLPLVTLEDL